MPGKACGYPVVRGRKENELRQQFLKLSRVGLFLYRAIQTCRNARRYPTKCVKWLYNVEF